MEPESRTHSTLIPPSFAWTVGVPPTKCIGMLSGLDRGSELLLFPSTAWLTAVEYSLLTVAAVCFLCLGGDRLADFVSHFLGSPSGNVPCYHTRSSRAATCYGYGTSAGKCFAVAFPGLTADCLCVRPGVVVAFADFRQGAFG